MVHEPPRRVHRSLMFLSRYGVDCVSVTEQTTAKCDLFVSYDKKVKKFDKQSFVVRRKDFRTLLDIIMIYSKQRTTLAAEISEIAPVIHFS